MASARRLRKRAHRLAARKVAAVAAALAEKSTPRTTQAGRSCWRCLASCRTEKPLYGWVCWRCAYELDRWFVLLSGVLGGDPVVAFLEAKRRGELPPPGPRGPDVNVRKPPGSIPMPYKR